MENHYHKKVLLLKFFGLFSKSRNRASLSTKVSQIFNVLKTREGAYLPYLSIQKFLAEATRPQSSSNKGQKANFCNVPISATYEQIIQISTKVVHKWCLQEQDKKWFCGLYEDYRSSKGNSLQSDPFMLCIEWQICS